MRVERTIAAALADDGVPLYDTMRALMEGAFGMSFAGVRLHYSGAADAANRALNALAFTVDEHVCFRFGVDQCLGSTFVRILAHELAHVAQRRVGAAVGRCPRAEAGDELLELEADRIADEVLRGRRVSGVSPDRSRQLRCWGPAGHYWTVYYAAAAAGVPEDMCCFYAFFAQMPDQVEELDATAAGEDYVGKEAKVAVDYEMMLTNPGVLPTLWRDRDELKAAYVMDSNVQRGLHCLTGGNANSETASRLKILQLLRRDSFEFALALHPFGDSFAHRMIHHADHMYSFPLGHLMDGHKPDYIGGRSHLYADYGAAIYDLFRDKWAEQKYRVEKKAFLSELLSVAGNKGGDDGQALLLREKIKSIEVPRKAHVDQFAPERKELLPWQEFFLWACHNLTPPQIPPVGPDLLVRALMCAREWA